MPDSQPWYVIDTNILIDFYRGDLLEALFALPAVFLAPDVIIVELEEPDGQQLRAMGLQSASFTGEQVVEVLELAAVHRAPSINDLFALVLAKARAALLLTGDGSLRRLAELEGIDVHGTLWLLDELVRLAMVTPAKAAEGLECMMRHGSRLPEEECERRLRQWRRG